MVGFRITQMRLLYLSLICLAAAGCASSSSHSNGPGLTLSLSPSIAVVPQNGTPTKVAVTVSGNSAPATVTLTGLPNGTVANVSGSSGSNTATIALTSSATTPAGMYTLQVTATAGNSSGTQNLMMVVAVSAAVTSAVDTQVGVGGKLQEFMSTSFQPAEWDYQFFQNHTTTEPAQLNALGPQHIRLQAVSEGVPMKANTGAATDWDFSIVDAIVQPVLTVTDNSPEFQIAVAPAFLNDPVSGRFIFTTANVQAFASYSANLVKYYNAGGFDWGGKHFQSPGSHKITWWGIYNEYNINGMSPIQYIQLYNAVVPAMLAVDNSIKISAMELAVANPTADLPPFVAPVANGGVNAQVNVVSTHFYPTCQQSDTDTTLLERVPQMVQYLNYVYQELGTRTDLANVPVWVTENNVNADYSNANGMSNCNPAVKFVLDPRGTSAFFAAWRPYVFSQLGKAGNQALYHWDYDADQQYGEVDYNTANKYLSYWVDYTLGQTFPSRPGIVAPDILTLMVTETSTVEVLATKNSDGSVVVMIADRAVRSANDNNGPGDPRTVIVDISALGNFTSASQITIDATTSAANAPAPAAVAVAPQMSITLNGYGVTFLTLKP